MTHSFCIRRASRISVRSQVAAHVGAAAILLLSAGCSGNPTLERPRPTTDAAVDALVEEMEATGQIIHRGTTPPNIEGTFDVDPLVLQASNFADGLTPGFEFDPLYITFSAQDDAARLLQVDYVSGRDSASDVESSISGSGQGFSVFSRVNLMLGATPAELLQVFSGEVESGAIRNFQMATFMLNDRGDDWNQLLEVGQGRVFRDADRRSPRE